MSAHLLSELVSLDQFPASPSLPLVWLRAREPSGAANHSPKGLPETQSLVEPLGPGQGRLEESSRKEAHPWHPRLQKVEQKTHLGKRTRGEGVRGPFSCPVNQTRGPSGSYSGRGIPERHYSL